MNDEENKVRQADLFIDEAIARQENSHRLQQEEVDSRFRAQISELLQDLATQTVCRSIDAISIVTSKNGDSAPITTTIRRDGAEISPQIAGLFSEATDLVKQS